jgi:methylglutaconyl-CoA hydratase
MSYVTIIEAVDERGVCTLTLNRPDKRNALSAQMVNELLEALGKAGASPLVRLVVLTGNGPGFCAGGDLDWFMESVDDSREGRIRRSAVIGALYEALSGLPKPLICRVNGSAFGAGVGLVAVCDTVLASASCRFGFSETRLGLIPGTFAPYVLKRIGAANARNIMLSGATFDVCKALKIGLIDEVASDENALEILTSGIVEDHLAAAPFAVAATKRMIAGIEASRSLSDACGLVAEMVGDAWETGEAFARIAERFGSKGQARRT